MSEHAYQHDAEHAGASREQVIGRLARERGMALRDARAIVDAGLPLHLGRGLRGGFDGPEVRVIEAARAAGRSAEAAEGGGGRVSYGNETKAAVRIVRDLLMGKGCPGPKQMDMVVGSLTLPDGGLQDPLERVEASREDLVAYATKKAERDDLDHATLDEMATIHEECGKDPFCRGRQLAAMLVAWHDVMGRLGDVQHGVEP